MNSAGTVSLEGDNTVGNMNTTKTGKLVMKNDKFGKVSKIGTMTN